MGERFALAVLLLAACKVQPAATREALAGQWSAAGSSLSHARGEFTSELRAVASVGDVLVIGGEAPAASCTLRQCGTSVSACADVDIFSGGVFSAGAADGGILPCSAAMAGLVA